MTSFAEAPIRRSRAPRRAAFIGAVSLACFASPASADKISHPTAVFEGLDKITGRTISFDVAINETVRFGTLEITPKVCYSRPPTDAPETDVFAQVDEIDEKKAHKRIFSGWMFADSPGLHGIEHPIYDIWLTDCKGGTTVIHETPQVDANAQDEAPFPQDGTDAANPQQTPQQAPPKKRAKPKPSPTVAASPSPPPGGDNAPLDLGGGAATGGNARAR